MEKFMKIIPKLLSLVMLILCNITFFAPSIAMEESPTQESSASDDFLDSYIRQLPDEKEEENSKQNKKRKAENESPREIQSIVAPIRKIYFEPDQIKKAITDIIMQEQGKIWAACYMVTSEPLTDAWIARKFVQQYEKAKQDNSIKDMISATQQLKTIKDDILIVDKENLKKDTRALKKLHEHGIKVLVRTKERQPTNKMQAMHLKFMVIYDEKNEQGKLLIKGSYNFTNQAQYNFEDVEITNDTNIINLYLEQHEKLRDYCENFNALSNSK